MDFDIAKENIQPLKGGRDVDRLGLALTAAEQKELKEQLESEQKEFEEAIKDYKGVDPLGQWYEYISWIEQSYPKHGNDSPLDQAVLKCIMEFENDLRYRQDRRLIKLYIKYIDTQSNPHEMYQELYNQGIGTTVADLYIAWSYYYDAINNFKQAEAVFRKGLDAYAQPYDELVQAHQSFSLSMSQRLLYDDEVTKRQFQSDMEEKRNALTSLRAHKKKFVGSLRTGGVVKSNRPGIVNQENLPNNSVQGTSRVAVHEDDQLMGASSSGMSVSRSIIDTARVRENTHEAGPWSKAKLGNKTGALIPTKSTQELGFSIMEDSDTIEPIPNVGIRFNEGIQLPPNFITRNNPQTEWKIPIVIEEPTPPNVIPQYEKHLLYPKPDIEMSPEELRAYKRYKNKGIQNEFTKRCDKFWLNTYEVGIRLPPNFVSKNIKQEKFEVDRMIADEDHKNLQIPFKKIYSENQTTEVSLDELLVSKWKKGLIKICVENDFVDVEDDVDMEETFVGNRRESIYPGRKSIVPKSILRKSMAPPKESDEFKSPECVKPASEPRIQFNLDNDSNQQAAKTTGCIRKSIIKRRMDNDENTETAAKTKNVSETPPRAEFDKKFSDNNFVKPQVPVFNQELMNDQNDITCSTVQFNYFIKTQSVSTPIAPKKINKFFPENAPNSTPSPDHSPRVAFVSPTISEEQTQPQQKQLSTIYETTETTQSTKSSVDPHISSPENEIFTVALPQPINELPSYRFTCERTETIPNILLKSLPPILMESMKWPEESLSIPKPPTPVNWEDTMTTFPAIQKTTESNNEKKVTPKKPIFEDSMATVPHMEDLTILEMRTKLEMEKEAAQKLKRSQLVFEDEIEMVNEVPKLEENAVGIENKSLPFSIFEDVSQDDKKEAQQDYKENEVESMKPPAAGIPFEVFEDEPPAIETIKIQNISWESSKIQEKSLNISASYKNDEIETIKKTASQMPFEIFEEHTETQAKALLVNQKDIPISSQSFHTSAKENFYEPGPSSKSAYNSSDADSKTDPIMPKIVMNSARKISEEFYEMTKTPVRSFRHTTNLEPKVNSLKFDDDNKPALQIQNAMHISNFESSSISFPLITNIKQEKSLNIESSLPSDSPQFPKVFAEIDDDNINTEKFSLNVRDIRNSTFMPNVQKVVEPEPEEAPAEDEIEKDFNNLSISLDEEEMNSYSQSTKPKSPEFKMPALPMKVPEKIKKKHKTVTVVDDGYDFELAEDLSKSIYYQKPVELPEMPEKWEEIENDFQQSFMVEENCYQQSEVDYDMAERDMRDLIASENGNPFSTKLRDMMLERCSFIEYLKREVPSCLMLNKVKPLKSGDAVLCGKHSLQVEKLIGKGSYGSIFKAVDTKSNKCFALKQERPCNLWEYYINLELFSRLKNADIMEGFMHIESSLIANNCSVYLSSFSSYGSIIDVCNKIKARTNRNVDEFIAMVLTTQILSIIDHLHGCKIIHADIKPDNFLLMDKLDYDSNVPVLQLIDFGQAIDMDWYEKTDNFNYVVKTENFTCVEMMENRPWTYQTDLFGVAGTTHVILFGKYMEVKKQTLKYGIKTNMPRYFNREVWENFFEVLLNVKSCLELPNLQDLKKTFKECLVEKEKLVRNKIAEFNNALN